MNKELQFKNIFEGGEPSEQLVISKMETTTCTKTQKIVSDFDKQIKILTQKGRGNE